MSKRFKWLAVAAVALLSVTGLHAQAILAGWDNFAGQEDSPQEVVAYGVDQEPDPDQAIKDWSVISGPYFGALSNRTVVNEQTDLLGNILNQYPGSGPVLPTYFGTHFTYQPYTNWYGDDVFVAQCVLTNADHQELVYTYPIYVTVTNVLDAPWINDGEVFILDCPACDGGTNVAVTLQAGDEDNWPTGGVATVGLTYAFTNGSLLQLTSTGTGYAELTLTAGNLPIFNFYVTDTSVSIDEEFHVVATDTEGLTATNTVHVFFTKKNSPILTDASAAKFHPSSETNDWSVIREGEAVRFTANWADYATNNAASYLVTNPCSLGVTKIEWYVYQQTPTGAVQLAMVTQQPEGGVIPQVDTDADGVLDTSVFGGTFVFDTCSDTFIASRVPDPHPYFAFVQSVAYGVCSGTTTNTWRLMVRPTDETPVITFDPLKNMLVGEAGQAVATEHNGNINGTCTNFMWYSNNGGEIVLDPMTGAFTAVRSGTIVILAFVNPDNQNLGGAVARTFEVMVTPDMFNPKVIVITGNDTNVSCYGEVIVSDLDGNTTGPWVVGTPLLVSALETAEGEAAGGYTFLRWGNLVPDFVPWYNDQDTPKLFFAPGGISSNGVPYLFTAIFKKTSELAVPVVHDKATLSLVDQHCFKVNEDAGTREIAHSDAFGFPFIWVQSEDMPGLDAEGLPPGMTFSAQHVVPNYVFGPYQNNNWFTSLAISGTPTKAGIYTVTLYATNGFWQAGHHDADGLDTNEVATGHTYTDRDIVGTFTFEVVAQELPIPDAWALTAPLTPAKETKPYVDGLAGCLVAIPDVGVCSDTPCTLRLDGALPAGISFSYATTDVSKDDSECGCYKQKYVFGDLLFTGTPAAGSQGPYSFTLVAVNEVGETEVGKFEFVVNPLTVPLVDDFHTELDCHAKVGHAYEINFFDPFIVGVLSDNEPVTLEAQNLPAGLAFTYVPGVVNYMGDLCNQYYDEFEFFNLKVSGTPTVSGTFTVNIVARNSVGVSTPVTSFELVVDPQTVPVVKRAPEFVVPAAHIDWAYEYVAGLCDTFACQKMIVWSDAPGLQILAQGLPAGLQFLLTDMGSMELGGCDYGTDYTYTCLKIFGTPTVSGTFPVSIIARNAIGDTTIASFDLVVQPKTAPVISNQLFDQVQAGGGLGIGRVGRVYDYTFAGDLIAFSNDGTVPTLAVTGLPEGLTFNFDGYTVEDAAFGKNYIFSGLRIVGTPLVSGTATVTFSVANSINTSTATLQLTVKPHSAPVVELPYDPITMDDAKQGQPYSFALVTHHDIVVKSDIPVTLKVQNLPAGLALSYDVSKTAGDATTDNLDAYTFRNLVISGTPTVAGPFAMTLIADNGIAPTATVLALTLTVIEKPAFEIPAALTASGTFDGWAVDGWRKGIAAASVKVPAAGKFTLTGKFSLADKSYTFKATEASLVQDWDQYFIETSVMDGIEKVPVTLQVVGDRLFAVAGDDGEMPVAIELFRNTWAGATPANGYYTLALPSLDGVAGSGYLTLTVGNKGVIKAAGKLADGTTRSFAATLINAEGQFLAVLNTAPASYKGGFLFGVVEFVFDQAQNKYIVRLFKGDIAPAAAVLWVNNNPMATANYNDASDYELYFTDYEDGINHGFVRALDVAGGIYTDTVSLKNYYVGNIPAVAELLYTFKSGSCSGCSQELAAQASAWNPGGLMISGWTAPKADSPKKAAKEDVWPNQPNFDFYTYGDSNGDGVNNSTGLKISFTKATGLFRGTFNVYYDYISSENENTGAVTVKHVTKKMTYQGVALPARADLTDGYDARGYFLLPDKSSYADAAGKVCVYSFNWSYDFFLSLQTVTPTAN